MPHYSGLQCFKDTVLSEEYIYMYTEVIYTSNNVEANARQNHKLNLRLWGKEQKFISFSNYSDSGGKENVHTEGAFTGKSSLKVVEY